MKKALFVALLMMLLPLVSFSKEISKKITVEQLIKKVDELFRAESSYAEMEMNIQTENWKRKMELRVWTVGQSKTFITIDAPKKDAGISTLRRGNEMWNFFPKINKVMRIPPSMMMSSWMGSDFSNDDLVKESSLLSDYNAKFETSGSTQTKRIVLLSKESTPVVWGKIVVDVDMKTYLPVTQEFYDDNGKKIREMKFLKVKTFDGRKIPSVVEMVPLNKSGHKTIIVYKNMKFNEKIRDEIFTLRNLKTRR